MRDIFAYVSMRGGAFLGAVLAGAITFLLSPSAHAADPAALALAKERIQENSRNDSTVRIGAALSLGASNDDSAGEPLCTALGDSNEVVRQAAAVALKRLNRPRTLDCLKAREPVEHNEAAKIAITRAIEAISAGGGGGGAPDPIRENPSAKYYISLSTIANATGRPQPDIERIVLKSIRHKLDDSGSVQIAPTQESADRAREVMKSRKMKGFYLAIAVDQFDYKDGSLRVKVKIGVFNYPNKALLGNVDKTLTAPGVSARDTAAEDRLLELAAGLVSEQFTQNASAFL